MRNVTSGIAAFMFVALAAAASAEEAKHSVEFIWEEAPFPSAHASTIVQTADGDLLAAWFGGTDEGNKDVGIWSSRKDAGAEAWTPPVELYKEPDQPAWNPVLFRDPSGKIRLWFKVGPSPREWTGLVMDSADGGRTWDKPVWLPSTMIGPVRCKPIILSNGDMLAGTSWESYEAWTSFMEFSTDGGGTWHRGGAILFGEEESDKRGTIQPTMMEVAPGRVVAFFRTRRMGKVARAQSRDYGRTWSPLTLTDLDHPGAGIDAVRLGDGRCVMVYNPSPRRRNPLSLAVSHDGGDSWSDFLVVDELADGEFGELSYPALIQSKDRNLHVTWTWKRQRIRHAEVPLSLVPER